MTTKVIETTFGPIKGCIKNSTFSRDFWNFQGVPYMKAPLGNLRFREPEVPEAWKEAIDCTNESKGYCQKLPVTLKKIGVEDAGILNVYYPAEANGPLPVLAYIHGGE
jgi:carboxylesterase type B